MKRLIRACVISLLIASASVAQGISTDSAPPKWLKSHTFSQQDFTFVRIKFRSSYARSMGANWRTDYPRADKKLAAHLAKYTLLRTSHQVLTLTSSSLSDHPLIYITEAGGLVFSDAEVKALRQYCLNGGLLVMDDTWGEAQYENVRHELRRVFPDQTPRDLPDDHQLLTCIYDLSKKPQTLSENTYRENVVGEVSVVDKLTPRFQGIANKSGRLMVLISHNNDLADGWSALGDDSEYSREIAHKRSLPFALNMVFYALSD